MALDTTGDIRNSLFVVLGNHLRLVMAGEARIRSQDCRMARSARAGSAMVGRELVRLIEGCRYPGSCRVTDSAIKAKQSGMEHRIGVTAAALGRRPLEYSILMA